MHIIKQVISHLIQMGANTNSQNYEGHTALMLGVIHQHDDIVKSLLK